jgi:hypothetical protein
MGYYRISQSARPGSRSKTSIRLRSKLAKKRPSTHNQTSRARLLKDTSKLKDAKVINIPQSNELVEGENGDNLEN